MKPLFLTLGSEGSPYAGMVRDHEARHRAYCEKWGMEYRADFGGDGTCWYKLEKALEAMEGPDYSHVFIVDADSMVVDFDTDLRECLPSWAFLGLVTHPYPMLQDVWHWNVGCSFWQNTQLGREFLTECLKAKERPGWHEQAEINLMLLSDTERWQKGFVQLSRHWNNNWHDQPHEDAVIMAWHGYMEPDARRLFMQSFARKHPWDAGTQAL